MRSIIIKSIVFFTVLQWSTTLHAGNKPAAGNNPLTKEISSRMSFPKSLIETRKENMQVRISFKLNANGEKEILLVNGPTEELKQFVIKAILDTPFSESTERNKEYNLVFTFRRM